jgi:hypothetical protein
MQRRNGHGKKTFKPINKEELTKVMETKELLTFEEAFEIFLKDCSIRNLREHKIKYYFNELRAFLKILNKDFH